MFILFNLELYNISNPVFFFSLYIQNNNARNRIKNDLLTRYFNLKYILNKIVFFVFFFILFKIINT